jgi:peptidoglycan/xylan/chitin deacetylase (PgdA/CDA1 family)
MQGPDADIYKLNCVEFRQHLRAISQQVPNPPITVPGLLDGLSAGHDVLLTFDDGGVSGLNYIADMLDEFAWKAHFLVTAGRISTPGFLSPNQIRELHRRGHIIGSHSYSHPERMSFCTRAELDEEWRRSTSVLSEIIGERIRVASVPCGYYSPHVASSAARSGIRWLFNSEPVVHSHSVDGCMVLGRFTIKRGDSPERSAAISAGAKRPRIQQYLFWNFKKTLKVLGGTAWLRLRIFLLARLARISSKLESGAKT